MPPPFLSAPPDRILALRRLLLIGLASFASTAGAFGGDGRRSSEPDPDRIINASMQFLKDREPEVTAEENAFYESALEQDPAAAIEFIEGLIANPKADRPASPAFHVLLGNLYYASGAVAKAEASYRKAVERYPAFRRAWTNLGILYYAQDRHAEAIPCFTEAVTLGARESTTLGMLGECLEATADAVGAEVAYIQALAGDPGNTRWMEGLLRVYLDARQNARAEVMVRKLIDEDPGETRHWLTYAKLMQADGRKLEAIALLEQTVAMGIAGDQELGELTGLYADHQLVPEAMASYGKIQEGSAALDDSRVLQLARMRIARSEWDQAQALLDGIKPRLADALRPEFLLTQADLLSARREWPAARAKLEELLRSDPMNGTALVALGRTYTAEGNDAHATLAFELAIQTREGARPARIELAHIELRNRHFEKSASHLEIALALEKNQDLELILERIRGLVPNGAGQGG